MVVRRASLAGASALNEDSDSGSDGSDTGRRGRDSRVKSRSYDLQQLLRYDRDKDKSKVRGQSPHVCSRCVCYACVLCVLCVFAVFVVCVGGGCARGMDCVLRCTVCSFLRCV
jgi:hypothetical protein